MIFAFLFAAGLFFINLGSGGIYAAQEGRTAIITRNMLLSGNWVDMQCDGGIPYEKPVGHYWFCLPFAALLGMAGEPAEVPSEWAVRLPSALSAIAACLAAACLALRLYGQRTAAVTVVVLSSMATFTNLGRLAHIDMPLAAAFTLAMLFFYTGYLEKWRANGWIYAFYAFLGWGVLLKGPLALILAGLIIFVVMVVFRRWKLLWEIRPLTGAIVFLAVALPWYVLECIRTDGAFYREFIVNQNIRRFTGVGSTYRDGERMVWYYYFPKLLGGAAPWSLAAAAALLCSWRRFKERNLSRGTVYLLIWVTALFVFFSCSALKRGDYLLPLYPALAILTARAITIFCEKNYALPRWWIAVWGVLAAVAAGLTAVGCTGILYRIGLAIASRRITWISRRDGLNAMMFGEYFQRYWLFCVLLAVVLSGLLFLLGRFLARRRSYAALVLAAGVIFCVFTLYHAVLEPGTDQQKSVKAFSRQVRAIVPPETQVFYYGDFNTELVYFVNRPHTAGFEKVDYVLTSPDYSAPLLRSGKWRERVSTPPGHQYPSKLLERLKN